MKVIKIQTNSIKLGQFLKLSSIVFSGGETKKFILENGVFVNEKIEKSRGKQLFNGDVISVNGEKYQIEVVKCN